MAAGWSSGTSSGGGMASASHPQQLRLESFAEIGRFTVKEIAYSGPRENRRFYYVVRDATSNEPVSVIIQFPGGMSHVTEYNTGGLLFYCDNSNVYTRTSKVCTPRGSVSGYHQHSSALPGDRVLGFIHKGVQISDANGNSLMFVTGNRKPGTDGAYRFDKATPTTRVQVAEVFADASQRRVVIDTGNDPTELMKAMVISHSLREYRTFFKETPRSLIVCDGAIDTLKKIISETGNSAIAAPYNFSSSAPVQTPNADLGCLAGLRNLVIKQVAKALADDQQFFIVRSNEDGLARFIVHAQMTPNDTVTVKLFDSLETVLYLEPFKGHKRTCNVFVNNTPFGKIENGLTIIDKHGAKVLFTTYSRQTGNQNNSTHFVVTKFGTHNQPAQARIFADNVERAVQLSFEPACTSVEWRALILSAAIRNLFNIYRLHCQTVPIVERIDDVKSLTPSNPRNEFSQWV